MRTCPAFGDVYENEAAFSVAHYEIMYGDAGWGGAVLEQLRAHISTTREPKSLF